MKKLVPQEELSNQFEFGLPGILPTKSDLLNWALGGGIPMGRQVMIKGKPGIGKSSTCLWIGGTYIENYAGRVFYYEGEGKPPLAEHAMRALVQGDLSRITTRRPENIAVLLAELETLSFEKEEAMIIVDSLASFGEERGEYGSKEYKTMEDDATVAYVANKYAQFCKGPFFKNISQKKFVYLVVNQLRDNMAASKYAEQTHTPGGNSPRYQDSVLLNVKLDQGWKIFGKNDDEIIGQKVTFEVDKNMIGSPHREIVLPFYYYTGFAPEEAVLLEANSMGIYKLTSGWCDDPYDTTDGKKKRIKKSEMVDIMKQDKTIYMAILEKVLAKLG